MSGLLSSFLIEPVVRQARRFSSSQGSQARPGPPPPAAPPTTCGADAIQPAAAAALSHANNAREDVTASTCSGHSPRICSQEHLGDDGHTGLTEPTARDPPTTTDYLFSSPSPVPLPDADDGRHQQTPASTFAAEPEDFGPAGGRVDYVDCQLHTSAHHATPSAPVTATDTASHQAVPASSVDDMPIVPADDAHMATPRPTTATPAHMRGGRTSSARDIPQAHMSLREDSPLLATGSLPADDGMRLLRYRIHQIRELKAPQDEKARRMHDLMTEQWHASQSHLRPQSPASVASHDRPFIPSSPLSAITTPASPDSTVVTPSPPIDPANPFNIHPEDLQPSYRTLPGQDQPTASDSHDEPATASSDNAEPILGCKHYKRNVKIQCYDCKEWHPCRHCHDASVTTHHLNRKATENMLCMLCWTPQAAGQYCKECGESAAWYYCDICKLWDDDASKSIYHCADCGICRRGEGLGKDFVHCKKCNVCISIAHYATHTCIENATDSNCPLCLDYMFTSPLEIVAMPCGHYLHHHCYTSLMLSTYQCPICKRSAVNMETQWRKLEEEIRHQPMPHEWGDVKVEVKCNDCAGVTVGEFHWLGVKCGRCDGFNTQTVRMLTDNDDVRRGVQDFAERRRERRAGSITGRDHHIRRAITAPVTVRPYFVDDDVVHNDAGTPIGRLRNAVRAPGDAFLSSFPELPRLPEFSGRLPNLAEYRARLPSGLPNMPTMPAMPGLNYFAFDLGVLDRVGRSLSPIRHYFDDQIVDGVPRQFWGVEEAMRGRRGLAGDENSTERWRATEQWRPIHESSEEDEDEEDDADESGSYEDDEEEYDDDEEEDEFDDSDEEMTDVVGLEEEDDVDEDEGGERLDIQLTGHR